MNKDQENMIREEFDERFTEHNLRDDLSEQKVARYIKDWFITKMKEQIEIAVGKERGKISKIINEYSPKKATETLEYVLLNAHLVDFAESITPSFTKSTTLLVCALYPFLPPIFFVITA